jgi:hypothetical protein
MNAPAAELHERAWELLPWLVNGRLDQSDGEWLMRHVGECVECARELQVQSDLKSKLASDARVEYAPQASFQKLMARIDEVDRAESRPVARESRRATVGHGLRFPRWLVATLATQAVMVIALTVLIGWQAFDRLLSPRYQTLTSAEPGETVHGNLRVVLAPSVTIAQFQSLLESVGAKVVAGPSNANVWTLRIPYQANTRGFEATLKLLRADERVVFAEPAASVAAVP